MAIVIAFCNQKGGAAKTTTTAAFAGYLSRKDKKVLCIDADQQGSLSFLLESDTSAPGLFEALMATAKNPEITPFIQHLEYCDLLSGDDRLIGAELNLANMVAREKKLFRVLKGIKDSYDYILIDTPPALSALMLNALVSADHVIIPTNPSVLHAKGMIDLFDTIGDVKESCNPDLQVAGIAITMYRKVNAHNDMQKALIEISEKSSLPVSVFDQCVRMSSYIDDAQRQGIDIFSAKRHSSAPVVADYRALIEEYLEKWS